MSDELESALGDVGPDRRAFLKRVAIGSAFAVPVVASFSMSGVQAVYAQSTTSSGAVSGSGTSASTSTSTTTTTNTNTTTTTLQPNLTPTPVTTTTTAPPP